MCHVGSTPTIAKMTSQSKDRLTMKLRTKIVVPIMHADMVPTYMRSACIAPPHITTHSRECRKTYPTERLQKPVQPSRTAELARPTSNATKTSSSQELTATEYAKRGYSELPRGSLAVIPHCQIQPDSHHTTKVTSPQDVNATDYTRA